MYKNKPLTARELQQQFQYVLDDEVGEVLPGEAYMMSLTSQNRDKWASDREKYFSTGKNKTSLSIIETALFVLIFEDEDNNLMLPEGVDDAKMSLYCKDLLCGRGWNRYFDKSFCLVCYPSCYLGVNTEHSWADAPIMGCLLEYCSDREFKIGYDDNGNCLGSVNNNLPKPERLSWDLTEECVEVINEAVKLAQERIDNLDLHMMEHVAFGKGVIKKLKISPDAFIQMALQLAYFKDIGKQCLTYEASMTRLFRDGRTETVRSATVESAAFVRAMHNDNCTKEERRRLLHEATTKHQYMYRMAMIGKGIDRHLFCLYVMSRYFNEESPFLKKVLSEPWRLSTSQTPTQQLGKIDYNIEPMRATSGGGFGPVAEDGYGVSYIIPGDYTIYFHVSSFKSSPKTNSMRFATHIAESLQEMKNLFED